jgi:hypothetical protein
MSLWHLTSLKSTRLLLWRTGAYTFRVMEYDEPADVLTNYDYVLFDRKYEGALRSTGTQLQLTPVTVTDEVRKLVWHYLEATIKHDVSADDLARLSPAGPAIYSFDKQYVFVSASLKATLQLVQGQALAFSPGLSYFGA